MENKEATPRDFRVDEMVIITSETPWKGMKARVNKIHDNGVIVSVQTTYMPQISLNFDDIKPIT